MGQLARPVLPVPFGLHTRHLLKSYCRQSILVLCAILTIALSIDLTFYLSKVLVTISQWQTSWASIYLARYVVLRGTDFAAELLPLACFFGVFWAEVEHTLSRERLIVWLSGRAPQQCLLPVVFFGIAVGGVQLALNYYLRPLAVMAMARDHLGFYGERYDPNIQPGPRWVAAGHDLVQGTVEPGDPPSLRDVKIYRMNNELSLKTFFQAREARPLKQGEWLLIDGYQWSPAQMLEQDGSTAAPAVTETIPFTQQPIDLNVSPIWINNDRVNARYLTNDVFSALSKESFFPDFEFRTWQHARWSLPLFCIAMTLFATSLSLLLLARKIEIVQLATIAAMGYFANALMKVFILLGEHGQVPAAVAGWLIPVMTLAACAALIFLRFGSRLTQGNDQELVHAAHFTVGK
jgi:lipopolysaccharide export system permease protein